ncbi:MAG: hypothetical protein JSR96_07320 [Proteobacteria bacterium]|nr:hypothetical protein [Pseudomonadota bacterium]
MKSVVAAKLALLAATASAATVLLADSSTPPAPPSVAPDVAGPAVVRIAQAQPCARGCLNPIETVTYASYLGDRAGVAGEFELTVRAVGQQHGIIFLNSETDYLDRNCLTIALPLALAHQIFGTTDLDQLRRRLPGKSAVFGGVARQVRIDLTDAGRPTGKCYYQVHVNIMSPHQALRLPSPSR